MINSFRHYLVEEEKTVFFTFGRMNPPTMGHEKLLDALSKKAGRNPYKVYLSQTQDAKKNPLQYKQKIKFARKMFPRHARQIIMDPTARNLFEIAVKLYNDGFKNVAMVVGSDRIREFEILLNKYNGKKAKHGFYNFSKINILSAGDRDPDAEGAEGMSATKMRAAAADGDFTKFSQGLPRNVSNPDAKALYNNVRKGMNLKEQKIFKNHVQLNSVSETREAYVSGDLLQIGDKVVIKNTDEIATVQMLGANYVIVEDSMNKKFRKWIDDVELIEVRQDPDIADRKGTQPAKYHAGLSKSTKAARDRQFKKQTKMADNNPAAYRPAPGDKDAKTKPSKYTTAVKKMFGEASENEITVGSYTTTHFHMCGSAIKAMKKHSDVDGAEELTRMQDDFYKFEKQFLNKEPSDSDKQKAQTMYDNIMNKAKAAGIEKDVGSYMKMHRDSILKGKPKPGFGRVNMSEQYTTKPVRFKMYEKTAVDSAKKRIDREKKRDAEKHDRMMDRARMRDTINKNRETKPNAKVR